MHDRKVKGHPYPINDLMFLLNAVVPKGHSREFCRPWLMSPNVYQIVDFSNPRKQKVVHPSRLKPAPADPESMNNEDGQSQQHVSTEVLGTSGERPPELQDGEDEEGDFYLP